MGGCSKTSKAILCFLSFIFWAAAAGLFYVGIVVFNTYRDYKHLSTANLTLIPASIILGVAVFMFIIGLLGCIAAARESRCLLAVFFSLVLVVLCGEIAAAALGYAYRKDVKKAVEDGLREAVESNSTEQWDQMNYIQKQLECCGVHNETDWVDTPYWDSLNSTLPESCCPNGNCNGTAIPSNPNIFQRGCYDQLEKDFLDNLGYVGGGALGLAVLQIFGLICTCILICRSRKNKVPYLTLGTDRSGLQV